MKVFTLVKLGLGAIMGGQKSPSMDKGRGSGG